MSILKGTKCGLKERESKQVPSQNINPRLATEQSEIIASVTKADIFP